MRTYIWPWKWMYKSYCIPFLSCYLLGNIFHQDYCIVHRIYLFKNNKSLKNNYWFLRYSVLFSYKQIYIRLLIVEITNNISYIKLWNYFFLYNLVFYLLHVKYSNDLKILSCVDLETNQSSASNQRSCNKFLKIKIPKGYVLFHIKNSHTVSTLHIHISQWVNTYIEFTLNRLRKESEENPNEQQVGTIDVWGGEIGEWEELCIDREAENGKAIIVGFGRNIRRSEMLSTM